MHAPGGERETAREVQEFEVAARTLQQVDRHERGVSSREILHGENGVVGRENQGLYPSSHVVGREVSASIARRVRLSLVEGATRDGPTHAVVVGEERSGRVYGRADIAELQTVLRLRTGSLVTGPAEVRAGRAAIDLLPEVPPDVVDKEMTVLRAKGRPERVPESHLPDLRPHVRRSAIVRIVLQRMAVAIDAQHLAHRLI